MTSERIKPFAAIVPVASDAVGTWRGMALLWDLIQHEPEVGWCVILDDCPQASGLERLAFVPNTCRTVALTNQHADTANRLKGSLTARILRGLAWIQANTDADFVLRIDTDALVIAPFVDRVRWLMNRKPDAGLIGTVGLSCNPELRALEDLTKEPKLATAHRLIPMWQPTNVTEPSERIDIIGVGRVTLRQLRAFNNVRPHIADAIRRGYTSSEFCQGGAYVVTRLMLDRMAASGYLRQPDAWVDIPFSEDRVIAMYARAVGVQICDYSLPGEPFGMNFVGLAYPPADLVTRGYSIIHSVKNDARFNEASIRNFFRKTI